jgi:hypothetical protein
MLAGGKVGGAADCYKGRDAALSLKIVRANYLNCGVDVNFSFWKIRSNGLVDG